MLQQILMQELPPAFILPGIAGKEPDTLPTVAQQGSVQALFDLLLLEFLRPSKEKEMPRVRTIPKATPTTEGGAEQPHGWKSWIPQSYFRRERGEVQYATSLAPPSVDYGKLF